MAINRFYYSTKYNSSKEVKANGIECVFISHQKADKNAARKIADYLLAADIDVYFDEYDRDLKLHHQNDNPKAVTSSICKGINNSSHMLVLVSPSTLNSRWVPFEVGYGYDKTDLRVLCLKGIPKGELPEYIRAATIIRDIWDLNNKFISNTFNKELTSLFESRKIVDYNNNSNPLTTVMDSLINEN